MDLVIDTRSGRHRVTFADFSKQPFGFLVSVKEKQFVWTKGCKMQTKLGGEM